MIRLACFALLIVAAGCAARANDSSAQIDSEFEDTISQIQDEFEKRGAHIAITATIQFGDPVADSGLSGSVADCKEGFDGKVINVSRAYWNRASQLARMYTLAHEIGHCVLGRTHVISWVAVNGRAVPSSIMFPAADVAANFDSFARDYYFAELVKGAKTL